MTNATYGKLTAGLIGAWFLASLTTSALHGFDTAPGRPPLPVGLAVVIPIALFLLWFAASKSFRQFVLGLNPRTVTLVHAWRLAGFAFIALSAYGILPGFFAQPAGWGDIAIGATAPFAALVLAVVLGTTARLIEPHAVATNAMAVLPMSLIPTFAVPLLLILHIIAIAQAPRWPKPERSSLRNAVPSSAV